MKSFYNLVALAALAANVHAACPAGADADVCTDFTEVNDLVVASSGDYTWQFIKGSTSSGYQVKLFRFLADAAGNQVAGQWTEDPIMFLAPENQDCTYWLQAEDDMSDSIPKQLFDAGYDVFLGCKRTTHG